MKVCIKCEFEKELSEFGKRADSKDGYRNDCKECRKEFNKLYKELNKESLSNKKKIWALINKEEISQKQKEYREDNKEKISIQRKEFRESNKERLSLERKEFREKNKELLAKRKKDYYEKNREKENKRKAKWHKNKIETDDNYKLRTSIRSLIYQSVKNAGYRKSQLRLKKTDLILGCTTEFFREYLEERFLEGMTWENHGEWHIDHKTPVSWGENEDDIYILNHYTNFQPLWAFDNLSKGNRFSG